ncbi:MAG: TetR/AcrR family transcriptional regulator [Microbacteriaceae bacterium]
MPRLTSAVKTRRRTDIATAALRCFERQGFAATSMADIIHEAGLSAGSIYSHFESKADLIRFAAEERLEQLSRALDADQTDDRPRTPSEILSGFFRILTPDVQAKMLLQLWASTATDAELAVVVGESLRTIRNRMVSLLEPWAAQTGDPSLAERRADVLMAFIQGYASRVAVDTQVNSRLLGQHLIEAAATLDGA